jgi:hypothetical protein
MVHRSHPNGPDNNRIRRAELAPVLAGGATVTAWSRDNTGPLPGRRTRPHGNQHSRRDRHNRPRRAAKTCRQAPRGADSGARADKTCRQAPRGADSGRGRTARVASASTFVAQLPGPSSRWTPAQSAGLMLECRRAGRLHRPGGSQACRRGGDLSRAPWRSDRSGTLR